MALSLRQTLARRSDGTMDRPLEWNEVSRHIREHYIANQAEKDRREKAARRQRFYQCRGDAEMLAMIQQFYSAKETVDLRAPVIQFAKYSNFLRRVVNEVATVYAMPAVRTVAGDENNRRYQEVQRLSRQHEVMQRINRMAFLHRALAVGPRMREMPDGTWLPVIDVVTPAKFFAVRDPIDPTILVALVFENDYQLSAAVSEGPKWTVVGWHETVMMNADGEALAHTAKPHGHDRIPWILLTLEPPDGCLLDEFTGEDLIAAHEAQWFLQIHHLKESKDSTVQTVVLGDTSTAIRRQVNDTAMTGQLPEGVDFRTVDRGMDVKIFTEGAKYVAETAGANYGIAPAVMRGESVTSADARELQRLPLRELRLQQHIPMREFERELAAVQAMVVSTKRSDLSFTTDGWGVNFADPQTPLGTKEALEVFEQERRMTLTSTREYLMKRDPDLSPEQADEKIRSYVEDELARNLMMRPLHQVSGSPGADTPDSGEKPATQPPAMRVIRGGAMDEQTTEQPQ